MANRWWYGPILPKDTSFPASCRIILVNFILSFSTHVSRKRPADTFLDFLTNSSSIVIVFLDELSVALKRTQAVNQSPEEAVRAYLRDLPESSLANVLSRTQQERKLSLVADDILQNFLDSTAYGCEPVKVFLRQMLAGLVLEMTITRCSKPEFINEWIVYLLEDGEPEFIGAIDAGVEQMKGITKPTAEATEHAEIENKKVQEGTSMRTNRADDAMDEAMAEAKRLTEMIAAEEAKRQEQNKAEAELAESTSTLTTEGMATPTSTDSDRNGDQSIRSSAILGQPATSTEHIAATPPRPVSTLETRLTAVPGNASIGSDNQYMAAMVESPVAAILTLHNASISIFDDAMPDDKSTFRGKPNTEYLLQIEPASSRFPGWMISRKFGDFETLHEVLRRISVISGVSGFTDKHATLPTWKGQTKNFLRLNLEQYLKDALQFEPLAESEGMKRFLDKDSGSAAAPVSKNPFAFKGPTALENMGKGLVDVLGNAPKGLAGGGKAVLGGVQGVFGAVGVGGPKKTSTASSRSVKSASVTSLPRVNSPETRTSQDSIPISDTTPQETRPTLPQRPQSGDSMTILKSGISTETMEVLPEELDLPPPPSSIEDDYDTSKLKLHHTTTSMSNIDLAPRTSVETETSGCPSIDPKETQQQQQPPSLPPRKPKSTHSTAPPITEEETRVAVELFFAIINELYSLSSAWNIRLTLLSAAKTFLLRPGNPTLESIRTLIQDSVITANFSSDDTIATNILKLRENALPTEDELKLWPPEPSPEEKEKLRLKARKLLVERGMPQPLTSVMGAAASGEALGRVFDCLQVEEVARGLMFALLLQAVRAATQ